MFEKLLDLLSEAGLDGRPYRGRFMQRGSSCVAVLLDEIEDLALLGPNLRAGLKVDNLASQFIAYWPHVLIPEGHELLAVEGDASFVSLDRETPGTSD